MTLEEFNMIGWHQGMKVKTTMHTLTRGEVAIECVVIGVNFIAGLLTLENENRRVLHRRCEEVTIIEVEEL